MYKPRVNKTCLPKKSIRETLISTRLIFLKDPYAKRYSNQNHVGGLICGGKQLRVDFVDDLKSINLKLMYRI